MYKLPASIEEAHALQRCAEQMQLSAKAQERLACIVYFVERGHSVSNTCRHFGITRSTLYRIIERFDPLDLTTLEDRSRKPKNVRSSSLPEEAKNLIRSYRRAQPHAGKDTIAHLLQEEHGITVSGSAVARLIHSEGLYFGDSLMHHKRRLELRSSDASTNTSSTSSVEPQLKPTVVDCTSQRENVAQENTTEIVPAQKFIAEAPLVQPDYAPASPVISPRPPEPPDTGQRIHAPPPRPAYAFINARFTRASILALTACLTLWSLTGSKPSEPTDTLRTAAPSSEITIQENRDTPLLEACRGVLAEYEIVNRWREEYGKEHRLNDREQAEINGCKKIVDTAAAKTLTPLPPTVSLPDGR